MKYIWMLMAACMLAGCDGGNQSRSQDDNAQSAEAKTDAVDDLNSLEFAEVTGDNTSLHASLSMLQTQVMLDRAGFSPGVIDGKMGQSLALALKSFQQANDIETTGELDTATAEALRKFEVPATRMVKIPAGLAKSPFLPDFPEKAEDQAKLPALSYRNMMEALAERFHTTPETLLALNSPDTQVAAGEVIRVPNIAEVTVSPIDSDERGWGRTLQLLGVSADQPTAAKVVVDKSDGVLRAFDADDKVIATFPATMGSSYDPLPLGTWTIKGVARNPEFNYNPKLFWDVSDAKDKLLLQPGPNGPVGVVWIDLSKPHYGIHGTNEPHTIGRAESHGCVRLTNWDAAKLAGMVKTGVKAVFQQ